jgi:hypothetical protein
MQLLPVDAPPLLAGGTHGLRPVARRIARMVCPAPFELAERAASVDVADVVPGRVQSAGRWADPDALAHLAAALDAPLRPSLLEHFEWYVCRGAHFHTDAHYADVLFGVWYLAGPAVDLVFPRAGVRIPLLPGASVIFDPFEVHGVVPPGATRFDSDWAATAQRSVFAGFELALDAVVRDAFGIGAAAPEARLVTSATRISAPTGAFE